jgi:hypothetical protein
MIHTSLSRIKEDITWGLFHESSLFLFFYWWDEVKVKAKVKVKTKVKTTKVINKSFFFSPYTLIVGWNIFLCHHTSREGYISVTLSASRREGYMSATLSTSCRFTPQGEPLTHRKNPPRLEDHKGARRKKRWPSKVQFFFSFLKQWQLFLKEKTFSQRDN